MIRELLKRMLGLNFTESNKENLKINIIINILMFIISGVMLFFLPEQIPILHEGAKNYNVPSILGVWLFPVLGLIINFSFMKQNRLSKLNTIIFAVLGVIMTVYYLSMM